MAEAAYRQHFYGHDHLNFYTEEPDIGPCLLSIKTEGEEGQYRCVAVTCSSPPCSRASHLVATRSTVCGCHGAQ